MICQDHSSGNATVRFEYFLNRIGINIDSILQLAHIVLPTSILLEHSIPRVLNVEIADVEFRSTQKNNKDTMQIRFNRAPEHQVALYVALIMHFDGIMWVSFKILATFALLRVQCMNIPKFSQSDC